jgi:hypothetical protein
VKTWLPAEFSARCGTFVSIYELVHAHMQDIEPRLAI